MAIYITGDTHGYYPQLMDRLAGNNCHLTKDDILLVTGDFGFVWSYAENIEAFKKLADEPFTVAFIDGNHEEFPLINSFPVSEWNGGNVHRIGTSENIIHLMRGQCFNIDDMSFSLWAEHILPIKIHVPVQRVWIGFPRSFLTMMNTELLQQHLSSITIHLTIY